MSGCCANCTNVRYDPETTQYECHFYVPEIGADGRGAWPIVDLKWDCRQWLVRLQPKIPGKDSLDAQFYDVPDGFPSR